MMPEPKTPSSVTRQELERAQEPATAKSVRDLIARMEPELAKSLGTPDAAARLARHYLTALRLKPELMECNAESLLAALLLSAQVGLEPGPLGHVYLVPYRAECQWILGYAGMIELARRSGACADLSAEIVWNVDEYAAPWRDERGTHYSLRPGHPDGRTERLGVLVTWRELSGGKWFARALDVPASRIERAQKASRTFAAGVGPWLTDPDAMWRKTGVRAARPFLPLTPMVGLALASDGAVATSVAVAADTAEPVLTLDDGPEIIEAGEDE